MNIMKSYKLLRLFGIVNLLLFIFCFEGKAQEDSVTKAQKKAIPKAQNNSTQKAQNDSTPNVIKYVRIDSSTYETGKDVIQLQTAFNKQVVLYVSGNHLPFSIQDSAQIYINNELMPYKVTYNCPCVDSTDSTKKQLFTLTFTLGKRDTTLWNKWYGFDNNSIHVKIDIGTKKKQYTCSDYNLTILMYKPGSLTFAWVVVLCLIILSILLAFVFKTNLIRDHTSQQTSKPFSLSRFQLLWWTVIIISCYILLYAIRDDFTLLSKTTLILLGISAAGTGFATLVDYSDSDKDRHQDQKGKNFLIDVLSDNDGISVHRYQNFVFTLIFGIIFFYKVLTTANMPDFGQLELFLMGLSTATYVGLKTAENKNPLPNQDQK